MVTINDSYLYNKEQQIYFLSGILGLRFLGLDEFDISILCIIGNAKNKMKVRKQIHLIRANKDSFPSIKTNQTEIFKRIKKLKRLEYLEKKAINKKSSVYSINYQRLLDDFSRLPKLYAFNYTGKFTFAYTLIEGEKHHIISLLEDYLLLSLVYKNEEQNFREEFIKILKRIDEHLNNVMF